MPTKEGLAKLYDTAAWQRRRALQLKQFTLCTGCLRVGAVTPGELRGHMSNAGAPVVPMTSTDFCSSRSSRYARIVIIRRPPPIAWALLPVISKQIDDDGWPLDPNHPANRSGTSRKTS
jgi:hypothetical protein